MWSRTRWMLALALFASVASGIAHAEQQAELVVAVPDIPEMIEPTQISTPAKRIYPNVFDKLISYNFTGQGERLEPALAVSWQRIDERTVEVTLRDGVKFHNGDLLTAEDVAFTFGDEHLGQRVGPYWGGLEKVEVTGPMSVAFTMVEPDPLLEYRIGGWAGEIINKRAFEEAGDFEEWARNPVGTGPYKVVQIASNDKVELVAHDDYWGGTPPVKRLVFREVPEISGRIAGLASGEYSVITNVPPDQIAEVEALDSAEVRGGPIMNHRLLRFEQHRDLMKDPHLRRALLLSIDRNLIVETLWSGKTNVPASHQFDQYGEMIVELSQPLYDLEKAKEELAKSSYEGETLHFPVVNNYYTNQVATAEILQQMWKAVGIAVDIQVMENWKQVTASVPDIRDWSSSAAYPDPVGGLWRQWHRDSMAKAGFWINEEFNTLGDRLQSSVDADQRRADWARMLEIWTFEDPGGTVLHQNAVYYGKSMGIDWEGSHDHFADFGPDNLRFVGDGS